MYTIEQKILKYIKENKNSTPHNISEHISLGRAMTHRYLKRLIEKNQIIKNGNAPKVYYTIKELTLPQSVISTLWSYDISKLNLVDDSKIIINNVLQYGSLDSTKWLFKNYDKDTIKNMVYHPLPGSYNKKSINYWKLILG